MVNIGPLGWERVVPAPRRLREVGWGHEVWEEKNPEMELAVSR